MEVTNKATKQYSISQQTVYEHGSLKSLSDIVATNKIRMVSPACIMSEIVTAATLISFNQDAFKMDDWLTELYLATSCVGAAAKSESFLPGDSTFFLFFDHAEFGFRLLKLFLLFLNFLE